jgi:hypothetical protein
MVQAALAVTLGFRPPEPEESAMSPRTFTTKDTKSTKGGIEDLLIHFPS